MLTTLFALMFILIKINLQITYSAARIFIFISPNSQNRQLVHGNPCLRLPPVQKVLSGSDRAGRQRLMGKYIGHHFVPRPEPDNTF